MKIGQTIIEIRKKNGMTQEDLANEFHVTRQTVSNWENERSYPDILTLIRISDTYGYTLDSMLKGDPDMTEVLNQSIQLGNEAGSKQKKWLYMGLVAGIFSLTMLTFALAEAQGTLTILSWGMALLIDILLVTEAINARKDTHHQTKPLEADDLETVRKLLDCGMKVEAVKLVRKVTGLGLPEAQKMVDELKGSASSQHE